MRHSSIPLSGRVESFRAAKWVASALALAAVLFIDLLSGPAALSKAPGATWCYRSVCHRVRTIGETQQDVGQTALLAASFYDDPRFDRMNTGVYTSNGEAFDANNPGRVASAHFPDGTELLLRNPENGQTSHVRVNDFGPFYRDRLLDVTRRVARDLGFLKRGVADLEVTVIAAPANGESRYRRNRKMPPARGNIGVVDAGQVPALVTDLIARADAIRLAASAPRLPPTPPSRPLAAQLAELDAMIPARGPLQSARYVRARALVAWPLAASSPSATLALAAANDPGPSANHPILTAIASLEPKSIDTVMAVKPAELPPGPASILRETDPSLIPGVTAVTVPGSAKVMPVVAGAATAATVARLALFELPATGPRQSGISIFWQMAILTSLLAASAVGISGVRAASVTSRARRPISHAAARGLSGEPFARDVSPLPTSSPVRAVSREWAQPPAAAAAGSMDGQDAKGDLRRGARLSLVVSPESESIGTGASVIGADITVKGSVTCTGRLIVAGKVIGRIAAPDIVIAPGGEIEGEVEADAIEVENGGRLCGRIAAGAVRLKAGAEVTGCVEARVISLDEGAILDAECHHLTAFRQAHRGRDRVALVADAA